MNNQNKSEAGGQSPYFSVRLTESTSGKDLNWYDGTNSAGINRFGHMYISDIDTWTNAPSGLTGAVLFEVYGNEGRVIQRITSFNTNKTYIRRCWDTNRWTNWVALQ